MDVGRHLCRPEPSRAVQSRPEPSRAVQKDFRTIGGGSVQSRPEPSRAVQSRPEPSNGFCQVLVNFGYGSFGIKAFGSVGSFGKFGLPGQRWLARPALASPGQPSHSGQPGSGRPTWHILACLVNGFTG